MFFIWPLILLVAGIIGACFAPGITLAVSAVGFVLVCIWADRKAEEGLALLPHLVCIGIVGAVSLVMFIIQLVRPLFA